MAAAMSAGATSGPEAGSARTTAGSASSTARPATRTIHRHDRRTRLAHTSIHQAGTSPRRMCRGAPPPGAPAGARRPSGPSSAGATVRPTTRGDGMTYELTGLEGKVAVVTGAGRRRSIGRPIAVELAKAGCDVVLTGTGRSPDRYTDDEKEVGWRDIETVADEVRATGRQALPLVSDVSDHEAVRALAERVTSEFGRVDIVVNNAGAARGEDRKNVVDLDVADWRKVIDVNLTGSFLMSKVFGQILIDQGRGGSIVN